MSKNDQKYLNIMVMSSGAARVAACYSSSERDYMLSVFLYFFRAFFFFAPVSVGSVHLWM